MYNYTYHYNNMGIITQKSNYYGCVCGSCIHTEKPVDYLTYYIVNKNVEIKPEMDITINKNVIESDGLDSIDITYPIGSKITFTGIDVKQTEESGDGTFVFTSTLSGKYKLKIEKKPYMIKILELEVL